MTREAEKKMDEEWMIANGRVRETSDTRNRYVAAAVSAVLGALSYAYLGTATVPKATLTGFFFALSQHSAATGYFGS